MMIYIIKHFFIYSVCHLPFLYVHYNSPFLKKTQQNKSKKFIGSFTHIHVQINYRQLVEMSEQMNDQLWLNYAIPSLLTLAT